MLTIGTSQVPGADDPPAGLLHESGFQMRTYDIARYTKIAQGQQNPQKAIIEWIFRRTGTADWHGEKIAVLCASKTQIRAYNSPEILKQVGEVVERFTNATDDILAIHVRFFVVLRHALAALGLLAAHTGRQRSPGAADLDAALVGRGAGHLADAASAGFPQAGR